MTNKHDRTKQALGFTLIELLIVVAVIGILAAIAVPTFNAYRQKTRIASCVSTAHSIRASLVSWASSEASGSFPQLQQVSSWENLVELCNNNGATLTQPSTQIGFKNWISYTPIDNDLDGSVEGYYLVLRAYGVARDNMGAQIEMSPWGMLRQTY